MVKFIDKEEIVCSCQKSSEKKTLKRGNRKQETWRGDDKKKGNKREEGMLETLETSQPARSPCVPTSTN